MDSSSIFGQAFITSRVDYCNDLIAGALKIWTDKLQLILNAAARLVTRTRKYDPGLIHILYRELHRGISQKVPYSNYLTVYTFLHRMALSYLSDLCVPLAHTEGSRYLRSTAHGQLQDPLKRLSTYGNRAFTYAELASWNNLPNSLEGNTSWFVCF